MWWNSEWNKIWVHSCLCNPTLHHAGCISARHWAVPRSRFSSKLMRIPVKPMQSLFLLVLWSKYTDFFHTSKIKCSFLTTIIVFEFWGSEVHPDGSCTLSVVLYPTPYSYVGWHDACGCPLSSLLRPNREVPWCMSSSLPSSLPFPQQVLPSVSPL